MISGYKTMIRCVTTRMCTTRTCTNTFVHWSFYYHHTLNLIDPCWVIDFNFISSRILPLAIMIRDDDKVRMVWVSSSHYHRPYGSIHVWIIDIVYTCPQLVPWVSKIMMWSLIIAARSFTIFIKLWLIGQNILMDPYTWSSISLLHSMMPYIYISDIAVLYPSLDGVPWPLLLWIISHTGYTSLIIHLLGHGSRLHELMDYKYFGIWSRRMYKTSPLILTTMSRGSNSSSKLFCYAGS